MTWNPSHEIWWCHRPDWEAYAENRDDDGDRKKVTKPSHGQAFPSLPTLTAAPTATRKHPLPSRLTPTHNSSPPTNMGFEDQVQKVGDWGE